MSGGRRTSSLLGAVALCAIGLACGKAGGADRIPIAVVPFAVTRGGSAPPLDLAAAIRTDLAASGRFAPIAAADLPSQPTLPAEVRAEEWQAANVDYVVVGHVARVHDGGHEVEFHLIDARSRSSLVAFLVPSAPDALEQTAQEIARIIEEHVVALEPQRIVSQTPTTNAGSAPPPPRLRASRRSTQGSRAARRTSPGAPRARAVPRPATTATGRIAIAS